MFYFYCNQYSLTSATGFDYLCIFLEKVAFGEYSLIPGFLKTGKIIILNFSFENIRVSEENIDVNK